ncbi:amidohydrolase [Serratia entomophila]|uniref:amidohydrolase n=1 Tax=Serratia entomophila TaxID=42906 RepID=UPI00218342B0|nr:amidohydrolase [Serratia entomophila]CAI2420798.1 N-substituted formamide deformylase precursor [Serratia entomophila]
MSNNASLIITKGKFHTVDRQNPLAQAVAIKDGKFLAVGSESEVMQHAGPETQIIDLHGHTAVPGLNDSHLHLIRGGLNYNLELRWEGVPSLADALRMLKEQALRTPSPQWVRVVGGWTEFQFAERRMPTLEEINQAAPDTPVFILHLYDRALLNRAALKVVGYTKDTPNPPGGEIQRDANGNPTGMLIAKPNAMILYATLAKGPKLPLEQQVNSTRQFMRELNRLGLTSAIDAGGGIAVQHRMAFQGEYFAERYGLEATKQTPPVAKMLAADLPVGLGTDATRVASYNPWTALYWLVSGRTVGGMAMYDESARLDRETALMLWTQGSAWFSTEQGKKGQIKVGQLADLAVLSQDYFSVPEEQIKGIESVMTLVDGKVVYAAGSFSPLAPPAIPVLPDWSPVTQVPGHYRTAPPSAATRVGVLSQAHQCCGPCGVHAHQHDVARRSSIPVSDENAFWGAFGCSCFAF